MEIQTKRTFYLRSKVDSEEEKPQKLGALTIGIVKLPDGKKKIKITGSAVSEQDQFNRRTARAISENRLEHAYPRTTSKGRERMTRHIDLEYIPLVDLTGDHRFVDEQTFSDIIRGLGLDRSTMIVGKSPSDHLENTVDIEFAVNAINNLIIDMLASENIDYNEDSALQTMYAEVHKAEENVRLMKRSIRERKVELRKQTVRKLAQAKKESPDPVTT